MNPKHFDTEKDWDIFAILLKLFENKFEDKAAERLQDFAIRIQVLLDHLMEHPEDRAKVFENIPTNICPICRRKGQVEKACPGCGVTWTVQPVVKWVKTHGEAPQVVRQEDADEPFWTDHRRPTTYPPQTAQQRFRDAILGIETDTDKEA